MITAHDIFFRRVVTRIFTEKESVIDVGGGLRIDPKRNNRYNPKNDWILPLANAVSYKIMDPVDTYNPDIVGDIHALPFETGTQEAMVAIAVLEHVENPVLACSEMYRVLAPGGFCFVYVPFLYYYHAEVGYYKDYWRFTHDSLPLLFKDFSHTEYVSVRGAFETILHLFPGGKSWPVRMLGRGLDYLFSKGNSKQTSGYYLFCCEISMEPKKRIVAVSGGFDPVHIGHVRMFQEARRLGDELVVIINNDNWLRVKKGYAFTPEEERAELIQHFPFVDRVVLTEHAEEVNDRSVCEALEALRPDVFANGGDRFADNVPELALCERLGIEMVFNIGGGKIQSSSDMVKKALNAITDKESQEKKGKDDLI